MPKKKIEEVKITKQQWMSFINNLLNIATHEWGRVSYCFLLKLFVDTGKVIGHAVLLALVTVHLGIGNLPIVMVISGILVMISTVFISRIFKKTNKRNLLGVLAILAALLLIVSRFVVENDVAALAEHHATPTIITYLFFALFLIAEAVFFVQLEIILALYIEEHFTSLESQRTFPIIESAQIFAGILGGSLITFLGLLPADYIYIWALFIILILPTMFFYRYFNRNPLVFNNETHGHDVSIEDTSILDDLKKNIKILKIFPYLWYMTLTVFFYYMIFSILDLKYAIAIFNQAETHGGEASVMHGLGLYILVFSVVALLIQLTLSSRIIERNGIINSMLLNPLFSLCSFFFMLFIGSSSVVIGARFIFDSTSVVYKNAYLSSFYAIAHRVREKIKMLIEGWAMPLGKIVGTLFAVLFQYLVVDSSELSLRMFLVGIATVMVLVLVQQRKNYTNTALRNLDSLDIEERFNAIEVLGEEGHVNNLTILTNKLAMWIEQGRYNLEKVKILETFARLKDESTLPVILDSLEDANRDVKIAALKALGNFRKLGEHFYTQTFARYRIINTLKELFEKEDSRQIKTEIIRVFANLNEIEVVPFLVEILKKSSADIQADCIAVIGNFNDPNIAYYLKPYLESTNPKIRGNTIIALWQFKDMRLDLLIDLNAMLEDGRKDKETLLSFIYASGELVAKQEEKKIFELMVHEDPEVKLHTAVALYKMGNTEEPLFFILQSIFSEDLAFSLKTNDLIKSMPEEISERIKQMIEHEVSLRINGIMAFYGHDTDKIPLEDLKKIRHYYFLIDEKKEVSRIEQLINKK